MSYFPCDIPFMSDDELKDNGIDICRITHLPCSECAPVCDSKEKHEKPPLGLMPRHIHERKRVSDILEAMKRYSDAEKVIPIGWINELEERIDNLKSSTY